MNFTHNNNTYELLFLTVAGSHLYGNARPESDWDYRGVFVSSKESKLGLLGTVEQLEGKDVYNALVSAGLELNETDDVVLYELNRFCSLALDNTPNIMDMLCHDYTNPKFSLYMSGNGKKLLDAKPLFMSTKLKHTFSGYAMSQLNRIKGHNKWMTQFPDTDKALAYVKQVYGKSVDWDWVTENFGGEVAGFVSNETAQKHTTLPHEVTWTWEDFNGKFNQTGVDFTSYRVPRLTDFMKGYDLTHSPVELDVEFLNTKASMRKFGESVLAVYTGGTGLFGREGNLRQTDSEYVGEFVCLVSVDQLNYKASKDHVNKMWLWKCNRNEKRSALEEQFGYDTKHASHLARLMEGAKDLLSTGVYEPTLTGERLQFVNDVRNGKYTYEWLLNYAETLDKELEGTYKTSTLPKKPDTKAVNKLVLELQGL
jgi:hypothetical protein